jgi:hypothetical protein
MLLGTPAIAERSLEFDAAAEFGWHFGHTAYKLEQVVQLSPDTVRGVGSELIFPLDVATVGLSAGIHSLLGNRPDWSVTAHLRIAATDPGGRFTDRDWDSFFGTLNRDFSYTESKVDISLISARIEVTKLIAHGPNMELAILAGFGYERISQEALGFSGWQMIPDQDSNLVVYPVSSSLLALKYRVTYLKPQIGLAPKLMFGPRLVAEFKAAVTPLLVSDTDEHLLRNFVATADGSGLGFISRASVRYQFDKAKKEMQPFIQLKGEFTTMKADIKAAIKWHGDDPAAGFQAGDAVGGLPHRISSRQYHLGLQVGFRF